MQTNGSQKEKRNGYLANTKMERVYLVFYFGFYHIRIPRVLFSCCAEPETNTNAMI